MSLATVYFSFSLISLFATLTATFRVRRIYHLSPFYFLTAWLTGELALHHLVLQLLTSLGFIAAGVLATEKGQCALTIFVISWLGLLYVQYQAAGSHKVLFSALSSALGNNYRGVIDPARSTLLRDKTPASEWLRPFHMKRPGVKRLADIAYGDADKRRNMLDIYQPQEPREGGYPVLLQVHGGAWMIGEKEQQGLPLMYHLAQRGWICVSINYRLSPAATFPDHIVDVKKAIAWIREHIAEYGGNSDFLAITGGSAGGHLSSLAALTANKAEFQPGFESANTSIDAAVPFYGVYDFLDRHQVMGRMSMEGIGTRYMFKCPPQDNPELWDSMSSESNVNKDAPPFFVIQGTHDSLVWEETASHFVDALRKTSSNPVAYAQVVGGQHAFDIFHCLRADNAVSAAADFLEWSYAVKKRQDA